jgi:DNA oxidative demethylase
MILRGAMLVIISRLERKANVTTSPAAQADLFAPPDLPGLRQAEGILAPAEEATLIAAIDQVELTPFRFHGWLGKRLTRSFGWRYDFDDARLSPAEPIPDWLLPLRERAARFAGLAPDDLVQALLIRYDPGAGIGWHRDRPVFEHVLGVSLGAPATLRFRRRQKGGFDRFAAVLPPRSLYHLAGEARHHWEHSIAPLPQRRWAVTFRTFIREGRASSP